MGGELSYTIGELERILLTIEDSRYLEPQWVREQYQNMTGLTSSAAEISRQASAVAKLAMYAINEGELWRAAYEFKDDWIGAMQVDPDVGISRSGFFEVVADVRFARNNGQSFVEIANILANTPSALRELRRSALDSDGDVKPSLKLPDGGMDEVLKTLPTLSAGEARRYVKHDVGAMTQRWVKEALWDGGLNELLMKVHVRSDSDDDELDLVVKGLAREDAVWITHRLGFYMMEDV